ncbi:hypothetical protein F4859DRAFT_498549 [Xylaria cf. heliscus]|nr:hypothetical protein F4859DRAFT_498549 [Xylaria cf. heliscus]
MAPTIAFQSEATRTIPQAITKILASRQATTTVIADGGGSSSNNLSGGAIAGIVIGSIAGFLLLWWIVRSCGILGRPAIWGAAYEPDNEKPPPHMSTYHASTPYARRSHSRHSHRSHHHHHSRSPRRVEVVQPVAYDTRGRSPRAPPAAYYGGRTSYDDRRRSSDARQHRHY